ncbi:MAG: MBL fold metallo-hydrolase [Clostridia bacterium]|nr:MBL fold metallo-hydrolase [Clostridia bacterium]
MKITWLGQAGFLFETGNVRIIIDPYLSDSCHKVNPLSYRRFPADEAYLSIRPDVLILTHEHLDHTDPETLNHYLKNSEGVLVLASGNAWQKVRAYGPSHNYVMFNDGTEFTFGGITFKAVYAEHSDDKAIGVIFSAEGKNYYITGDTLYNKKVFESLPDISIDAVFLPINGKGNNMNYEDAMRFADRIGAGKIVPCHFGLFDSIDAKKLIDAPCAVIPIPFEEIIL